MASTCQLGHVMNYDATFCQRCGTLASTDVGAADVALQALDTISNKNTQNYHPSTMPNS